MTGSSLMVRLLPLLSLAFAISSISPSNASLVIPDFTQRDAPTQSQRDRAHSIHSHSHQDDFKSPLNHRKSLGFGPHHSHQVFVSDSAQTHQGEFSTSSTGIHSNSINTVNALPGSKKPEKVALRLAKFLVGGADKQDIELFVRKDSYLDRASGIYHAFVRQRIHGIQIADSDLNVAIDSKGNVLSYGSSLYHGSTPSPLTNPSDSSKTDSAFCDQTRTIIEELLSSQTEELATSEYVESPSGAQTIKFVTEANRQKAISLQALQEQLYSNCAEPADAPLLQGAKLSLVKSKSPNSISDPRQALISFLSEATTDPNLASELKSSPDSYVEMISQSFVVIDLEKLDSTSGRKGVEKEDYVLLNGAPETEEVKATLAYVQTSTGQLALTWKLVVPMKNNHYETYVDATREDKIHSVIDWVQSAPARKQKPMKLPSLERPDFTRPGKQVVDVKDEVFTMTIEDSPLYKVFEWGVNDPSEGHRALLHGVRDDEAAPLGWHTVPTSSDPFKDSSTSSTSGNLTTYHDTRGNFVFASADLEGLGQWAKVKRPQAVKNEDGDLTFDFDYGYKKALKNHKSLDPHKYKDAAATQLFYTINNYAEMIYRYGFTEEAGNFQQYKPDGVGKGGDAVIAFAQANNGMNNADFSTPPAGQHGRMRMYLWSDDELERDGDFEAGVVIHEFTHGISTRLVGGPDNSGCLGWGESGGMGEGWGDWYATAIRMHSDKNKDWTMGSWVAGNKGGIRKYPYSTNNTVDPVTYSEVNKLFEVHGIGGVWAEFLFEVLEAMILEHGWQDTLFPPSSNATQSVLDDFYLTSSEVAQLSGERSSARKIPRRGNTLSVQLVTDAFKLMPCRPSFLDSRDAVIQADKHLTGGANACLIWKAFAKRGLGVDAKVVGQTPWGGGLRTDGFSVPKNCKKI